MMIEGFETKQCSKCGGVFALTSFQEGRNQCKSCIKARKKAYRQSDKRKAWQKAWRESDKRKACYKKHNKKRTDELSDGYVASLLTKASELKASDIPPELIEIKRLQIKIKREIACQTN